MPIQAQWMETPDDATQWVITFFWKPVRGEDGLTYTTTRVVEPMARDQVLMRLSGHPLLVSTEIERVTVARRV